MKRSNFLIIFVCMLLQSCAAQYIAPTVGEIATIRYITEEGMGSIPSIFKFETPDCKGASAISNLLDENGQLLKELEIKVKANEVFLGTLRYMDSSPGFVAYGTAVYSSPDTNFS